MINPYLSDDESILLAADSVEYKSVSLAAVLTNKRILLIQSRGDDLSAEEIQLPTLHTAEADVSASLNPVIRVSFMVGSGPIQEETLTFSQKPNVQRVGERDTWVTALNEHIQPSLASGPEPAFAQAPPSGDILAKHDRPAGLSFPAMPPMPEPLAEPPWRRNFIRVAALIIVIIAVIGGAFYSMHYLQQQPALPSVPAAPAPTIPAVVTMVSTLVPMTPQPTTPPETPGETVSPAPSPLQVLIPQTGVWVRVQYPGNFTGSVGEGGNFRPVQGSGDRFYQISIKDGIVNAIFQKQEGSGNLLTVDIYQNGASIQHRTTTAPKGEVNIQIEVKAETPAPTLIPNVTATKVTTQKPEGTT